MILVKIKHHAQFILTLPHRILADLETVANHRFAEICTKMQRIQKNSHKLMLINTELVTILHDITLVDHFYLFELT